MAAENVNFRKKGDFKLLAQKEFLTGNYCVTGLQYQSRPTYVTQPQTLADDMSLKYSRRHYVYLPHDKVRSVLIAKTSNENTQDLG